MAAALAALVCPWVSGQARAQSPAGPALRLGGVSILAEPALDPPGGGSPSDLVEFAFAANPGEAVSSWKVSVVVDDFEVVRRFSGEGRLPSAIAWDGRSGDGSGDGAAPGGGSSGGGSSVPRPGSYCTAVLEVDFGGLYQPTRSTSRVFTLQGMAKRKAAAEATRAAAVPGESPPPAEIEPPPSAGGVPGAAIELSPAQFAPGEDAGDSRLVVRIVPSSGSPRIASWTMTVYDPAGHAFASFDGAWPKDRVSWDGRNPSGAIVESCSDYRVVAMLRGEDGSIGRASGTITTGVVLLPGKTKYSISVSSITFKPDTANFRDVDEAQARRNQETLRLLARKLMQFPGYRIRIEGHAVSTHWGDPGRAAAEEREELIPLSAARARAIRGALIERGIEPERMEAVGLGSKEQVVPDSDEANRWKNRRVSFVLQRE